MCDPVSLTVGATVVKTGLSVAGSLAAGSAKDGAAKANASLLDEQAKSRLEKGKYDEEIARRQYGRALGTNLAKIAGSGVDARSFYDVLADDAMEAALQRKSIRYGANAEAKNLRFQAAGQRAEGRDARRASFIQAGTAVVEGAASLYGSSVFDKPSSASASPWLTTVYPTMG